MSRAELEAQYQEARANMARYSGTDRYSQGMRAYWQQWAAFHRDELATGCYLDSPAQGKE